MTVGSDSAHSRPPDLLHPRNHHTDIITQSNITTRKDPKKDPVDDSSHAAKLSVCTATMEMNNNKLPQSRHNVTPIYIIPDHSLSNDWHMISPSPGSTFMYETDPADQNKALLSPGTGELIHSPVTLTAGSTVFKHEDAKKPTLSEEDSITLTNCDMSLWCQMDGPPIQDYLTDFINAPDGSSIKAIGDELAALTTPACVKQEPDLGCEAADCSGIIQSEKMVDSQMGLKDKMVDGPTLAQLNDGESVLDMFMPLSGQTVSSSQGWSCDSSQITVVASTSSTLPRSSSIISMTATGPSWEESYNFATTSSGMMQVPPLCIKSESLTRASLTSCRMPGAMSNKIQIQTSASSEGLQRPAGTVLSTASLETPIVTVPNSQALGSTGLKQVLEGCRPPTNKSLQELLSVATTSHQAPKVISVVPLPEASRGKKRSLSPDSGSNGTGGSMERKWEEIRCYIDSNIKLEEEKRLAEARELAESIAHKRVKLESQGSQNEDPDVEDDALSIKQELDSDFDNSDDDLSDVESNASYSSFVDEILHGDKKEKRYFWQYNTQSKGPKGKRLCKSMQERDPHSLADFEDPVFQPEVNDVRYKHNGKARKGDGNDITPSPWKLFQIGNELQKLTKKINGIAETEKPVKIKDGVKSKSRKEKNKFASRACRLKKKAQHEANKVKLFGLESEHHQLMEVLKAVKRNIYVRIKDNAIQPYDESFTSMLENQIKEKLTTMIAGNTSDYVNTVLQKVAEGDKKGGIFPNRN